MRGLSVSSSANVCETYVKDIRHKRNINVFVGPGLDQLDLSTPVLLGRSPQQLRPSGDAMLLQRKRQGQECSHATGGDQVMATCVTNSRKRIVLGVEVDQATPGTTSGLECRVQPICMAGDGEALLFKEIADQVVGSALPVCKLRIRPNLQHLL